jgi:hypothetical protein
MKKLPLILLTLLILTLTACGVSNTANPSSVPQSGSFSGALPATTQLILGTFKLEDTDQAVTAEQAAELLPLWQTLHVLSESDSAAEQEKEALITQIQETMTPEQMQAITDMSLTREDMRSIMQEQGMAMGNSQSTSGSSSNSSSGFQRGAGGPPDEMPMPAGGGPPGGGFGGQGQNLSEDQIATAQAARQEMGENFVPPVLINAVVEYLQKKADS